jgi:regulatory protein
MSASTQFKRSLKMAMEQCSRMEMCEKDIRNKLHSQGLSQSESDEIIDLLARDNFINEERFAKAFINDKFIYNKWGKLKITSYLKAKNIPADIITKSLDTIDKDLYKKTIGDLLSTHRRIIKAKNQYDLKAKLLRYGLSKGYESSLLYDLINDLTYDSED